MNRLSVSWTLCGLAASSRVRVGSAGRLMSMASAVVAASAPSSSVSPQDSGLSIDSAGTSGILEAENRRVVIVGEELGVARPIDGGIEDVAGVLLAQVVLELA